MSHHIYLERYRIAGVHCPLSDGMVQLTLMKCFSEMLFNRVGTMIAPCCCLTFSCVSCNLVPCCLVLSSGSLGVSDG